MFYHNMKMEETEFINFKNTDYLEKLENNQKIWKNIKSLKTKKMLLSNFIDKINESVDDNIIIQKNKLLLKGLTSNLKYIDDDNIILLHEEISQITGIDINDNGLLIINNILYKNKKIPR